MTTLPTSYTPDDCQEVAIARGDALIAQYQKIFDGDEATLSLQLIADVIEWCAVQGIDFDRQVSSAREMLCEID